MKEEFRLDGGGGGGGNNNRNSPPTSTPESYNSQGTLALESLKKKRSTWSELRESDNSKCSLLIFNLNKLRIYTYSFSFPTIEKTVNSARKEMEKIQISLCSHFLLASLSVIVNVEVFPGLDTKWGGECKESLHVFIAKWCFASKTVHCNITSSTELERVGRK